VSQPINDGGPPFPHSLDWVWSEKLKRYEAIGFSGMTIRDYFAAAALQGILADGGGASWDDDAKNAFKAADAMLKARGDKP
jgi:hypothetical protein